MRFLFSLFILCGCVFGGYYAWNHYPPFRTIIEKNFAKSEFLTLEIRYSAESIMEAHRKEFLKNENYSYLEPKLVFYPYLLMEVKFAKDMLSTQEGFLLFGLNDGEMILDATNWEKTHGFKDCLQVGATAEDFKILRPLIENGGFIERDKLSQKYKGEKIDKWIENCKIKKLIVVNGTKIRLHFDRPLLSTIPITQIKDQAVTFPAKSDQKISSLFSPIQIQKLTSAAFGQDFAILKSEQVYLPVYRILIQNPDGSVLSTSWNALTGQRL